MRRLLFLVLGPLALLTFAPREVAAQIGPPPINAL